MSYTVPKLDDYSPAALDRAAANRHKRFRPGGAMRYGVTKLQPERSEGDTIC
jgi:hypothetical protein